MLNSAKSLPLLLVRVQGCGAIKWIALLVLDLSHAVLHEISDQTLATLSNYLLMFPPQLFYHGVLRANRDLIDRVQAIDSVVVFLTGQIR